MPLHERTILIIVQRDNRHPTGVSFNKARKFKLKNIKNPRTKVGIGRSDFLQQPADNTRHSLEFEGHEADDRSYNKSTMQARGANRQIAVATSKERNSARYTTRKLEPHGVQDTDEVEELDSADLTESRGNHAQLGIDCKGQRRTVSFREIARSDSIYDDVTRTTGYPRSYANGNALLQSADAGCLDPLRAMQRIAEGRVTSEGLPIAMRNYITDLIEKKRFFETASGEEHLSGGYGDGDIQALIDNIALQEGPVPPGVDSLIENLGKTSGIDADGDCQSDTEESSEDIFAVALGRKFAVAHHGQLDADSQVIVDPASHQSALVPSDNSSHGRQRPHNVEAYLRSMPGMTNTPMSPPSIMLGADSSWSFQLDDVYTSLETQNDPSHDSSLADLARLMNHGVPTPGELQYLSSDRHGRFGGTTSGYHSLASRCDDLATSFAFQGSAMAYPRIAQAHETDGNKRFSINDETGPHAWPDWYSGTGDDFPLIHHAGFVTLN